VECVFVGSKASSQTSFSRHLDSRFRLLAQFRLRLSLTKRPLLFWMDPLSVMLALTPAFCLLRPTLSLPTSMDCLTTRFSSTVSLGTVRLSSCTAVSAWSPSSVLSSLDLRPSPVTSGLVLMPSRTPTLLRPLATPRARRFSRSSPLCPPWSSVVSTTSSTRETATWLVTLSAGDKAADAGILLA